MGTYRQPSLVLDKSFEKFNAGMAEFQKNLMAQMQLQTKKAREQEKEAAKATKEAEKRNHEYNAYGREIETKLVKLQPLFMDDSVEINTSTGLITKSVEDFEQDMVNIQNGVINPTTGIAYTNADLGYDANFDFQNFIDTELDGQLEDEVGGAALDLKTQVRTLYKELKNYNKGSKEYEYIVNGIETRLAQAPVLFNLLDNTSKDIAPGYDYNGKMRDEVGGVENIILRDGQPDFDIRSEMSKNIIQKTNQGRFRYVFTPDATGGGMSKLVYTNKDKTQSYEVPYDTYNNRVQSGQGGLLSVTRKKPLNDLEDSYFKDFFKKGGEYLSAIESKTTTRSTLNDAQNVRTRVKEKIKNVDIANNLLYDRVSNYVTASGLQIPGDPNGAQNIWQLIGGKGTFDPVRDEEKAIDLMYEYMLNKYGQKNVTDTEISSTQLKEGEMEVAAERLNAGLRLRKEGQEYLPDDAKKDVDKMGRADFGYQDIFNNFPSLTTKSGNKGITALLSDLPQRAGYEGYKTGDQVAEMWKQKLKEDLQGVTDADDIQAIKDSIEPQIQAYSQNPSAVYRVKKPNKDGYYSFILRDLGDFDTVMDEIYWLTRPNKGSHQDAIDMIDQNQDQAMNTENKPALPGMA